MKPAFALSFSENGISLHHHSDGEWYCVGTVPLDVPDLAEQMQALRDKGFALANHLGCVLIIPPDQLRLLTVDTDGLSPEDAAAKVEITLAEATPYALSELAYTSVAAGPETQVAAVARQTLDEARAFAVAHGFVPEAFRAGETAEPPLHGHGFEWPVDAADPAPDASPPVPTGTDDLDNALASEPDATLSEPEPIVDPTTPGELEAPEDQGTDTEPGTFEDQLPAAEQEMPKQPAPATALETSEQPTPTVAATPDEVAPADVVEAVEAPDSVVEAEPPEERTFAGEAETTDEQADANDTETTDASDLVVEPETSEGPTPAVDAETPDEIVPADVAETPEGPDEVVAPETPEGLAAPVVAETTDEHAAANDTVTSDDPSLVVEPEMPVHAIAGATRPEAFRSTPALAGGTKPSRRNLARYAIPAVAASVFLGMALGAWSVMGPDSPPAVEEQAQATPESEVTEPPQTDVAAVEPETEAPEAEVEEPLSATDAAILEALSVEPEVEEQVDPSATDPAILEALNMPPEPVEPIAQDPDPQTVLKDFTGTAPTAPPPLSAPQPDQTDEMYLVSVDKSDLSLDALALPQVESLLTDLPPDLPTLPGGQDQQFDLDDRGLVTATPEGTLNPDGVVVYLGRPSSVPPEPPVRFEAEPEPTEPDERLAGFRPRVRPDNLVDQFERSQLGGRSLAELAVVRPKLRPESLKVEPEIDYTPTALAVVRVPRPKPRPANLAPRTASAGTANLGSTANVASTTTEPGSFAPKTVSPKIPTTASVARQATIDNAINLRRLNLIGVYGTPANRRALVRLPSGRYKKLKVGDRIDGGKVVAIGDSELRYQKRGKNVTLKMPRG